MSKHNNNIDRPAFEVISFPPNQLFVRADNFISSTPLNCECKAQESHHNFSLLKQLIALLFYKESNPPQSLEL